MKNKISFYISNSIVLFFLLLSGIYGWGAATLFLDFCYPIIPMLIYIKGLINNYIIASLIICYIYINLLSWLFFHLARFIYFKLNEKTGFYVIMLLFYIFYGILGYLIL